MKGWRMTVGVLMAALAVGTGRQALGQFTAAAIAEQPKWEEFLKTAPRRPEVRQCPSCKTAYWDVKRK